MTHSGEAAAGTSGVLYYYNDEGMAQSVPPGSEGQILSFNVDLIPKWKNEAVASSTGNVGNEELSSLDNAIPRYHTTSGRNIQGSNVLLDDDDKMSGLKTASFSAEYDHGLAHATCAIDWNEGQKQKVLLDQNCLFAFTAPPGPCNLLLKVAQMGTFTAPTWDTASPAEVLFPGGTAPTITTGSGAIDILSFYYDGTDYYGVASLDFQNTA